MDKEKIKLFAPHPDIEYGKNIADILGLQLSELEERNYEGGEHKMRPLENVRGKHVFVIQSLYGDENYSINDKLCRLLFFIATLKEDCAAKVIVLTPYLCYSRKDRQTKPRDPVTTRYVAMLFESMGTDHFVTLDVHNLQAYQNAFRCYTDNLECHNIFAHYFFQKLPGDELAVLSPDEGGMKRADKFRQVLGELTGKPVSLCFREKFRNEGILSGEGLIGNVNNKTVIIYDDMISSGNTLIRAARSARENGAQKIFAVATHGIFSENAAETLNTDYLDEILITNSIHQYANIKNILGDKLHVLETEGFIAKAIRNIYTGDSVNKLLEPTP